MYCFLIFWWGGGDCVWLGVGKRVFEVSLRMSKSGEIDLVHLWAVKAVESSVNVLSHSLLVQLQAKRDGPLTSPLAECHRAAQFNAMSVLSRNLCVPLDFAQAFR